MIHIAPCSCELHQALREALERNAKLEAELAQLKSPANRWWLDIVARAEKAERELAELEALLPTARDLESARERDEREREAD